MRQWDSPRSPDLGPSSARKPGRGLLGSFDPVEAHRRRTSKIREEIARNRRGEYTVPTWALTLALAAVIAVWLLVLFVL